MGWRREGGWGMGHGDGGLRTLGPGQVGGRGDVVGLCSCNAMAYYMALREAAGR